MSSPHCQGCVGRAGGSGLNVIVVVNQNSTNSVQLGNNYCEQRGVPPQNFVPHDQLDRGAIEWTPASLQTLLLNPLLAMVSARGLTNQAEYVLLSMDIPYRVSDSTGQNGTTSALFYGFKTNVPPPLPPPCLPGSCTLPDPSSNSYAFSELPFPMAPPTRPYQCVPGPDADRQQLQHGEPHPCRGAWPATAPSRRETVYLEQTSDPARNVRFLEFDNAIMNSRIRGENSLVWIVSDSTSFTNILGR